MIIKKDKGMGPGDIDWDALNLSFTHSDRRNVRGFVDNNPTDRIKRVSVLADSGDLSQFYLLYYAILFDSDIEVRLAALKSIHKYSKHPDFKKLIEMIYELNCQSDLEPDFSQLLQRLEENDGNLSNAPSR